MVQALGGNAWLNMQNQMLEGQIAAFSRAVRTPAPPSPLNITNGPIMTAWR